MLIRLYFNNRGETDETGSAPRRVPSGDEERNISRREKTLNIFNVTSCAPM